MATSMIEKEVVLVGVDDSEHGYYALEWTLDRFFTPFSPNSPFKLVVVYGKPTAISVVGFAGAAEPQLLPYLEIENDLRRIAARVVEKAKQLCAMKLVNDAQVDVMEGDARDVLCEAVHKHHASILVVGSHGYGAIKRALLGSVSDYCAHNAHCSVLIVKKPKMDK